MKLRETKDVTTNEFQKKTLIMEIFKSKAL